MEENLIRKSLRCWGEYSGDEDVIAGGGYCHDW